MAPPTPVELAAPLRNTQSAVAGHFTARLTGRALRWKVSVGNVEKQPLSSRIAFDNSLGPALTPVTLNCQRCVQPGAGFVLVTSAQAAAIRKGRASVVVPATSTPNGPLRGPIAAQ